MTLVWFEGFSKSLPFSEFQNLSDVITDGEKGVIVTLVKGYLHFILLLGALWMASVDIRSDLNDLYLGALWFLFLVLLFFLDLLSLFDSCHVRNKFVVPQHGAVTKQFLFIFLKLGHQEIDI